MFLFESIGVLMINEINQISKIYGQSLSPSFIPSSSNLLSTVLRFIKKKIPNK
jgi:hypothetical protein